jgi:site-specific recombinase XerD
MYVELCSDVVRSDAQSAHPKKNLKNEGIFLKISEIDDVPDYCKEYLTYLQSVRSLSQLTVREYYLDLRTFFRYLKLDGKTISDEEFDHLNASDYPLEKLGTISLQQLYDFQTFRIDQRSNRATTRMRKISSLHGLYKYLLMQKKITKNPTVDLRFPKKDKTLPYYLTFEQSLNLLQNIDGRFKERNLAIVTIFLNCGIRLSELVGLNYSSIQGHEMRVFGKGRKERMLYLNDACLLALDLYKQKRRSYQFKITDPDALFISQKGSRISPRMVQVLVREFMQKAGIDTTKYSVHKLRHTAATLMYQNGVDIRVLQEILGHVNLGTTQIYTHISTNQIEDSMKSISISEEYAGKTVENIEDNDKTKEP